MQIARGFVAEITTIRRKRSRIDLADDLAEGVEGRPDHREDHLE